MYLSKRANQRFSIEENLSFLSYYIRAPLSSAIITFVKKIITNVRPPLNKKSFPVHQPGGLKRADLDFFFMIFEKVVFSQSSQYILVNEKLETGKKKKPTSRLAFLAVTRRTGTIFYLRMALGLHCRQQ